MQQKTPSIKVVVKHWRGFLFAVVSLFLLYGLSIGPAYRLYEKSVIPIWFYQPFYLPIHELANHSKWFDQFIGWYEDLWYAA